MKFSKSVYKQYRESFSVCSSTTMLFGLIIIQIMILGYVFPISYIITIPFVVIPFLFGYQICLIQAKYTKTTNIKTLFAGVKIYYSPRGYGAFSSLRGLLKAFIAFVITLSIALSISISISMGMDASLKEIITKIVSSTSIQEYTSLLNDLIKNSSFIFCSNLSILIAFLPCIYMFFHNTFVYSLKTFMSLKVGPENLPMKAIGIMYRFAFPYIRKNFYKNYYSVIWINIILFILGYASGATLGMIFLFEANALRIATLGLSIAFLLNLLLLPLVFILLENLFLINKTQILSASIINAIKEAEEYLKDKSLNSDERKQLEEMRDEYKKALEEFKKKR